MIDSYWFTLACFRRSHTMDVQWTPISRFRDIGDHHPSFPGEEKMFYQLNHQPMAIGLISHIQYNLRVKRKNPSISMPVVFWHCVQSICVSRREFQSFFQDCIGNAISYGPTARTETAEPKFVGRRANFLRKGTGRKPKTTTVIFKVCVLWV